MRSDFLPRTRVELGTLLGRGIIPLCVPNISGNEVRYVMECLESGWVSSAGPFVERFEEELAYRLGAQFAVATTSGTAALHLALLVAGLQPDEEVILPALTFIAPANAVRYCGGWPVFIDVDRDYWQLDAAKMVEFLTLECEWRRGALYNRETGRRIRGIVPVHLLGHPVDMEPILEVARKYNLFVIEDATESLGAKYRGTPVGHLGDGACLSFNGNKIITTGGGGMFVTDRQEWAERARYLSTQAKDDPVEYVHRSIGFNYRLTNLQAAVGLAQLERLDEFVSIKRRSASLYAEGLRGIPGLRLPSEAPWAFSTFWLFTILVQPEEFGQDRRALMEWLRKQGIQTRPLWQPLHRNDPYRSCLAYRVEVAEAVWQKALSLPSSTVLTDSERKAVIEAIRSVSPAGHSHDLT